MRQWFFVVVFLTAGACGAPDPCDLGEPGVVCEVAGTGILGFNRDGLPPQESDLYLVSTVKRGPDGLIYLMDFNNHRLRVIEDDGLMYTIAGDGFHAFAHTGDKAVFSPLENPIDFDFLPSGELVFVQYHDPRVLRIDRDGILQPLAGTGNVALEGDHGDGGNPLLAEFIQIAGIAVAPDGTIYVSDTEAHRVRVIRGDVIETLAGTGKPELAGDGGPASEASVNWPTGLTLDAAGNLFIADQLNHVVRRVDAVDGTITTVAGTGVQGFGGDGGPATSAQLDSPDGVAVAPDGTLYIADRNNFRVRRVLPDGSIDTFAGGQRGFAGNGGPAVDAEFGFLARITLSGDELFIADQSNSCARKIIIPQE